MTPTPVISTVADRSTNALRRYMHTLVLGLMSEVKPPRGAGGLPPRLQLLYLEYSRIAGV